MDGKNVTSEGVAVEIIDAPKEKVKEDAEEGFVKMPVKKLVLSLSMPIMLSTILLALYETVDSIMIGNALGNAGLAGSGVFYPLTVCLCYAGALMLSTGLEVQLSEALGANNVRRCRRVIAAFLLLSIVYALILPIIILPWLPTLLKVLGATQDVVPMTIPYAQVIICTQIGYSLTQGCSMIYAAVGKSKFSLIGNLVSAATNIGLDYAFLFHSSLGLCGASIATAVAQLLSAIIMIIIFCSMEHKKVKRGKKMMRRRKIDRIGKIDIEDESETSETESDDIIIIGYSDKDEETSNEDESSPDFHNKKEILKIPSKNTIMASTSNQNNGVCATNGTIVLSSGNSNIGNSCDLSMSKDNVSFDKTGNNYTMKDMKMTRHRDVPQNNLPISNHENISSTQNLENKGTLNSNYPTDISGNEINNNASDISNLRNKSNEDKMKSEITNNEAVGDQSNARAKNRKKSVMEPRELNVSTNSIIPWFARSRRFYEGDPPYETRKEKWRDIGKICAKICSCGIGSALGEITLSLVYILTNVMIGMSVNEYDVSTPEGLAMNDAVVNMLLSAFSTAVRLQYYCLIPNIAQQQSSVVLLSYNKPDRETHTPSEMSHLLSRCISIVKISPIVSFIFVVLFTGVFITLSLTGLMEKLFNIELVDIGKPLPLEMQPDFIIAICLVLMILLPPIQVYGTEALILDNFEDGGQRCRGKKMPAVARSCLLLITQPLILVPLLISLPLVYVNPMSVWITWPISDIVSFILGMCLTAKNIKHMNKKRKELDMEAIASGEQRTMEVAEEVGDEVTLSCQQHEYTCDNTRLSSFSSYSSTSSHCTSSGSYTLPKSDKKNSNSE